MHALLLALALGSFTESVPARSGAAMTYRL